MGEFLGPAMLAGMFIGPAVGAGFQSTIDYNNVCDSIDKAKQSQANIEAIYQKLAKDMQIVDSSIKEYMNAVGNHKQTTITMTAAAKNIFKQVQISQYISLGIFFLSIVLGLLFKYFNVFDNIWNFFTK